MTTNTIYTIGDYLENFRLLLTTIKDSSTNNLVIAGTHALLLHGLKMSRNANDLDIVIYKPTDKQILVLKAMLWMAVESEHPSFRTQDDYGQPVQRMAPEKQFDKNNPDSRRCVKFKKGALTIDILLEWEKDTPIDLLWYKHGDSAYKIQSVANIIAAKRFYAMHSRRGRSKDLVDFLDLKNSNFNCV